MTGTTTNEHDEQLLRFPGLELAVPLPPDATAGELDGRSVQFLDGGDLLMVASIGLDAGFPAELAESAAFGTVLHPLRRHGRFTVLHEGAIDLAGHRAYAMLTASGTVDGPTMHVVTCLVRCGPQRYTMVQLQSPLTAEHARNRFEELLGSVRSVGDA